MMWLNCALQEKGPDGGRISREHPLELATLAKPTAPESPEQQSPREPLPLEMHRPHSAPALAQETEEPAAASPQGGVLEQSSSPGSTLPDGAGGKAGPEHADGQADASTAVSPVAGASADSSTAATAQPGGLDHAAAGPSADMQPSGSAPVAAQPPQLHVQTSAPEAASPGVSPFAAVPAAGQAPQQDANAADGEPPPPLTPPHSPPRVSHSIERTQQSADEDSAHSPPAATRVDAQSLQHWPDMADTAADAPHSIATEGQASERVAVAEADVPQEDAHPPSSHHPQGGHEQFSILVRNCRMLGPGLPHSLASRGGAAQEQVIRELMPQVGRHLCSEFWQYSC